jgi:hypothetical protein
MSNWELVMPGGGLTAIGLAGLVTSYGGIAHTFIDGMHALTGLLFFIGLIFLSAGILDGGVSTSNRTKATVLVVISIVLGFGAAGFVGSTSTTLPTLSGILILIAVPAIIIPYVAVKMPQYVMMIAGTAIRINIPESVGSVVLVDPTKPAAPKPKTMDITTRTVAFVLLEVETPPSRIPALKNINPIKNSKPVSACIPSMNVCAIPPYDVTSPANPIAVSPPPGMTNSQLLIQVLLENVR